MQYARTHDTTLREELVTRYLNLVRFLARKFANRGESIDDLISVSTIGLLHAIDRFDPARGCQFTTFAIPTIVGEIKRGFRDHGWAIHVPRRQQELHLAASKAIDELRGSLNRAPSVEEVAAKIGATLEETLEGMELGQFYELTSLDADTSHDDDGPHANSDDVIGAEDLRFNELGLRSQLEQALRQLPPRECTLILLRFFKGWSQAEIAQVFQISQMHVSRLQAKAQARLREILQKDQDLEAR
jgi:RNA polymerase sigma-B factor